MRFVIQNIDNVLDEESFYLKKLLTTSVMRFSNTFCEISINEIDSFDWDFPNDIPVGSLQFVGRYLEKRGLSRLMKPIEIPKFLQTEEFLGRKYEVLHWRDLPESGSYFVKDVSVLKSWTPNVFLMSLFKEMMSGASEGYDEHYYSVQSKLDIVSEYRVLVCQDGIVGVQFYDGTDILKFPDGDIIKKIINQIVYHRDVLKELLPTSYTLDVCVDKRGRTLLIEMHNFVSCGTYGFSGDDLIYMYRDGIDFEVKQQEVNLNVSGKD